MRRLRVLAVAALLLLPASAQADPVVNGVFDIPGAPGVQTNGQLTVGPDGNIWVALDTAIAKVTPDGTVTVFESAQLNNALGTPKGGITSAGGFIWVSQDASIGKQTLVKIDPANPGGATGVNVTNVDAGATALTLGPDGNVWVGLANKLVRFSPSNTAASTPFPIAGLSPKAITASTDGTLWVTDNVNGQLVNVKTDGTFTPYVVGGQPQFVGAGPNGQIAFGNPATPQAIALLSPGGTPLTLSRPNGSDPFGVAFGADGAYWIAEFAGNRLARVTTDGQLTTLTGFPAVAGQGPRQIVAGPGNTLWATLDKAGDAPNSKIARITGVDPPPPPPPQPPVENPPVETPPVVVAPAADTTPPALSGVSLTAARLRFTSSEAGTARVVISRKAAGKRSRGKCVKPTKKLRKARRCTRLIRVRTLSAAVTAGANSVRIPTGKLVAGRYTVTVRVTDAAGNESKPSNRALTVKRKRA